MCKCKELEARIAALEAQTSEELVRVNEVDFNASWSIYRPVPTKTVHRLTLFGELEAIRRHLGLEIDVQQRKVIEPSVKVEKGKK